MTVSESESSGSNATDKPLVKVSGIKNFDKADISGILFAMTRIMLFVIIVVNKRKGFMATSLIQLCFLFLIYININKILLR